MNPPVRLNPPPLSKKRRYLSTAYLFSAYPCNAGVLACELQHRPGASINIPIVPPMLPAARRRRNSQPGRPRYDKIAAAARPAYSSAGGQGVLTVASAFSLIEMLVVVGIIGIIAALVMPSLKGFREGNVIQTANRQLVDDFALARLKAINERTTVYVVFMPPGIQNLKTNGWGPKDVRQFENLVSGQYNTYALFTKRRVGAQPGRDEPRYLTPWKTLPEGVFIAPAKFQANAPLNAPYFGRPFAYLPLPFPSATGPATFMPAIAFNYLGQLRQLHTNSAILQADELIPLTRGSVFYSAGVPDLAESPAGNWTNNYNAIRINWLTGRARVDHARIE